MPPPTLPSHAAVPVTAVSVALGIVLLAGGRRLFWLFVGGMGFVLALEYLEYATPQFMGEGRPEGIAIALAVGAAGALFAIFLQKLAIGLTGAFAGAYYLTRLLDAGSVHDPRYAWVSALAGAVIGALLLLYVFKWALVFFSSILGAHLLIRPFDLPSGLAGALFLALTVAGIIVQGRQLRPV